MKKNTEFSQKIFLIINFSNFGDVLLTNTLCQNIKLKFPESKVIFITNSTFVDAAKYQKDTDEAYGFDKRGKNKGLLGILKFAKTFPYKNKIFASFVIYGNDRGILLSRLLKAKHIISGSDNIMKYLITDPCSANSYVHMQDINGEFLEALTKERTKVLPMKILPPKGENKIVEKLNLIKGNREIIGLTCISKAVDKDMPILTAAKIIKKLYKENKLPVLLGVGEATRKYANELKKMGILEFIDLTDVTSIADLMQILNSCKALISVDTGTMHMACALGVPVVALFYKKTNITRWAPRKSLYKCTVIDENFTTENIITEINSLID